MKTYATLHDFMQQEIVSAILGQPEAVLDALVDALYRDGCIEYGDGWDGESWRLDRAGFRWSSEMAVDQLENGSQIFWGYVRDALAKGALS